MRKYSLFMGQNPQYHEGFSFASTEIDAVALPSAKNFSKVCLSVLIHVFNFWNLTNNSKMPMEK